MAENPETLSDRLKKNVDSQGLSPSALHFEIAEHEAANKDKSWLERSVELVYNPEKASLERLKELHAQVKEAKAKGDETRLASMSPEIKRAVRDDQDALKRQSEVNFYATGFAKAVPLFAASKNVKLLALSVGVNAADQAKVNDGAGQQALDLTLGGVKGFALKKTFDHLGASRIFSTPAGQTAAAEYSSVMGKGLLIGGSSRLYETALNSNTYRDKQTGETHILSGLGDVASRTLDPRAMALDATIFSVAHGSTKLLGAGAQKLVDASPGLRRAAGSSVGRFLTEGKVLQSTSMGMSFGFSGGAAGEWQRQSDAGQELDAGKILKRGFLQSLVDGAAGTTAQSGVHGVRQYREIAARPVAPVFGRAFAGDGEHPIVDGGIEGEITNLTGVKAGQEISPDDALVVGSAAAKSSIVEPSEVVENRTDHANEQQASSEHEPAAEPLAEAEHKAVVEHEPAVEPQANAEHQPEVIVEQVAGAENRTSVDHPNEDAHKVGEPESEAKTGAVAELENIDLTPGAGRVETTVDLNLLSHQEAGAIVEKRTYEVPPGHEPTLLGVVSDLGVVFRANSTSADVVKLFENVSTNGQAVRPALEQMARETGALGNKQAERLLNEALNATPEQVAALRKGVELAAEATKAEAVPFGDEYKDFLRYAYGEGRAVSNAMRMTAELTGSKATNSLVAEAYAGVMRIERPIDPASRQKITWGGVTPEHADLLREIFKELPEDGDSHAVFSEGMSVFANKGPDYAGVVNQLGAQSRYGVVAAAADRALGTDHFGQFPDRYVITRPSNIGADTHGAEGTGDSPALADLAGQAKTSGGIVGTEPIPEAVTEQAPGERPGIEHIEGGRILINPKGLVSEFERLPDGESKATKASLVAEYTDAMTTEQFANWVKYLNSPVAIEGAHPSETNLSTMGLDNDSILANPRLRALAEDPQANAFELEQYRRFLGTAEKPPASEVLTPVAARTLAVKLNSALEAKALERGVTTDSLSAEDVNEALKNAAPSWYMRAIRIAVTTPGEGGTRIYPADFDANTRDWLEYANSVDTQGGGYNDGGQAGGAERRSILDKALNLRKQADDVLSPKEVVEGADQKSAEQVAADERTAQQVKVVVDKVLELGRQDQKGADAILRKLDLKQNPPEFTELLSLTAPHAKSLFQLKTMVDAISSYRQADKAAYGMRKTAGELKKTEGALSPNVIALNQKIANITAEAPANQTLAKAMANNIVPPGVEGHDRVIELATGLASKDIRDPQREGGFGGKGGNDRGRGGDRPDRGGRGSDRGGDRGGGRDRFGNHSGNASSHDQHQGRGRTEVSGEKKGIEPRDAEKAPTATQQKPKADETLTTSELAAKLLASGQRGGQEQVPPTAEVVKGTNEVPPIADVLKNSSEGLPAAAAAPNSNETPPHTAVVQKVHEASPVVPAGSGKESIVEQTVVSKSEVTAPAPGIGDDVSTREPQRAENQIEKFRRRQAKSGQRQGQSRKGGEEQEDDGEGPDQGGKKLNKPQRGRVGRSLSELGDLWGK